MGSYGNTQVNSQMLQDFQNNVIMNAGQSSEQTLEVQEKYYSTLSDYLTPNQQNLELAQNIFSGSIIGGSTAIPGQAQSYSGENGDGYVDFLGYLGNNAYPPVEYPNDRVSELNDCAKDLPMFLASTMLPKPSVNADDNALAQDAARALAAWTNLSPVEQFGGITSTKSPYSKITSFVPVIPIPDSQKTYALFNNSSINFNYGGVSSG